MATGPSGVKALSRGRFVLADFNNDGAHEVVSIVGRYVGGCAADNIFLNKGYDTSARLKHMGVDFPASHLAAGDCQGGS